MLVPQRQWHMVMDAVVAGLEVAEDSSGTPKTCSALDIRRCDRSTGQIVHTDVAAALSLGRDGPAACAAVFSSHFAQSSVVRAPQEQIILC